MARPEFGSATPTTKSTRRRSCRWCVVCDAELITCKHYSRLDSAREKKSGLVEQFTKIFGDLAVNRFMFVCDKCTSKVRNAVKLDELQGELIQKFQSTRERHSIVDSFPHSVSNASPRTTTSVRPKRRALFSPGTPKSEVKIDRPSAWSVGAVLV